MRQKLVWTGLALAGLWAGLRWFERANLYIPSARHEAHPGSYGLPYEDLSLSSADGARPHGWFLSAGPHTPSVVVVFHGNGGNISHRLEKARALRAMGHSVLLFDYRGYGKSLGRPSEKGLYLDGEAAAREGLARAGGDPKRVAYYGESLGCAVALETALRLPPAALVLDSPFASTVAMGRAAFPWLPSEWLVRERYDNAAKIPRLKVPLQVMHSPQDDIIPFAMGRQIFSAAPEPKTFVETQGDHNEGFMETPHWASSIQAFLAPLQK
ncbi:MAG: alpha/beta hydrolase [Elusimicrobia bacterium]|nr:alpha/beta hydrolase [Elusimicrobiota bacterium]